MRDNNRCTDDLYRKLDSCQKALYESILDNKVTCCNARAGTGKTTIAVLAGFDMLKSGQIQKIIYIRFPDQLVQSLGHFPGDLAEKESYYMGPFIDACAELGIDKTRLEREYFSCEEIVVCTNITLRGTNMKNSLVILDEAQNATFNDLKLVLTRLHDSCHCIIMGHSEQCDNKKAAAQKAFEAYINHMCQKQWAKRIDLKTNYRGSISTWADKLMLEDGKYYVEK